MFSPKNTIHPDPGAKTYPLGENAERPNGKKSAMALLALSHTTIEHRLYLAMLATVDGSADQMKAFTARALLVMTGIRSLSTIRRGLDGLIAKLSIEREVSDAPKRSGIKGNGNGSRHPGHKFRVFSPEEIVARRKEMGLGSSANGLESRSLNHSFERALCRIGENRHLSRRESQVALCCVEGLTNAEIGERLQVSKQTVKFHLRHVFIKFGVKRRAELISRLLM